MSRLPSTSIVALVLVLSLVQIAAAPAPAVVDSSGPTAAEDTSWQPTAVPDTQTYVVLESDPDDTVGLGRDFTYVPEDADIQVWLDGSDQNWLRVKIEGFEVWLGDFLSEDGGPLTTGVSEIEASDPSDARRIGWSGPFRSVECETVDGWFAIDELTRDAAGELATLRLRFAFLCDSDEDALRGAVRFDADAPAPAQVNPRPEPHALWRPHTVPVPAASGDPVVLLESTPEDFVGEGQTYAYTGADVRVLRDARDGHAEVYVSTGDDHWSADVAGPDGHESLESGYYGEMLRYAVHNPRRGGVSWGGNGRGCNRSDGWVMVDDVAYTDDGSFERLVLRFSQRCVDDPEQDSPLYGLVAIGVDVADIPVRGVEVATGPERWTNDTAAQFTFAVDDGVDRVECQLDDGPWQECGSVWSVSGLAEGEHVARVASFGPEGAGSAAPAWSWTVDLTPPTVTILEGPPEQTTDDHARVLFSSKAPDVALAECRLDGGAWEQCSTPWYGSDLEDGHHTLDVRVTDRAGNAGVASHSWQSCHDPLGDPVCHVSATADSLPVP